MQFEDVRSDRSHGTLAAIPADQRVPTLGYASVRSGPEDHRELNRQAAVIERFCADRDWDLTELINEVQPAAKRTSPRRPALMYTIEKVRSGEASCVVVSELRRLCNSVAELGPILALMRQADVRLVSLAPAIDTSTVFGRAAVRLLIDVSDWEQTRRAEMTSAARANGAAIGGIGPDLRRRIIRMRRTGMTIQAIADQLNDEGVPTARGGAIWRTSSVQAALGYKRPDPWSSDAGSAPDAMKGALGQ